MCGIVGIVGNKPVADRLVDALEKLEYRGYDSAGIATISHGSLGRVRACGKLTHLKQKLKESSLSGDCGIGHTRWATHGIPSEANAHPHSTQRVAIVHNGIIENHAPLRQQLMAKGHHFESLTDSEVIAHLLNDYLQQGDSPEDAVRKARKELVGAFAIACIFHGYDDLMIVAREGASPLAVGLGQDENYVGSDALALSPFTDQLFYLEEGDMVILSSSSIDLWDREDKKTTRPTFHSQVSSEVISKEGFTSFMEKEIHHQPQVVEATLDSRLDDKGELKPSGVDWNAIERVTFAACGTAFYAGMVAKYWFEKIARLPFEIDIASEFRYRMPPLSANGLCMIVSQSGETADTLAALEYAKSQDQTILSIVNVPESSIERASHITLQTLAGPEIGVASTKAFTTQLVMLATLAIEAALARQIITSSQAMTYVNELCQVPSLMHLAMGKDHAIRLLSQKLAHQTDTLFLGRDINYPMAMEGALKLKEISYIHAEAYAAGEMKHGPIALLEEGYPVIVIAPSDSIVEKTASNVQEALARGAWVIAFTDAPHIFSGCEYIEMPGSTFLQSPFVSAVFVQFLAYHTAQEKGTDVDQPRNLAKSVTVE
jgi:glucosamine--fructose-6-phosphate aminotransferase (isomerizing)